VQPPGPDLVLHHGATPVTDYHNPHLFPGLHPTLYPYGIGGFEDSSQLTPLSFERQAKYSLNLSDHAFRYHDAYIFVILNILQWRQAHLQTHFAVCKSSFDLVARSLTSVSPHILHSLADHLEQECKLSSLTLNEQNTFKLLHQVNTMSTRITGSQSSKIFMRNEIHNYFGYFGLPHVFFTFNPSAAHSPIFQVMYGDQTVDLSARFPCMPSGRTHAICLAHDPVTAADFYEFSFKCLFQHLLGWDFDNECSFAAGGILGHIHTFYGTSEFTERGALHGHFLIWLQGGLNPSDLHTRLHGDKEFQAKFFWFFEDAIYHHLPEVEDMIETSFEPRVQRPPRPPLATTSTPVILNEWQNVFSTEIKRCGEALQ
jgi:hypothetical protein